MLYLNTVEKRVALLYVLYRCRTTLSNEKLTTTIIETTPINWIETQDIISSLEEDSLIHLKKQKYEITPKGEDIVKTYLTKIPETIREAIDTYIENNMDILLESSTVLANLKKSGNLYEVCLTLNEIDERLIQLKLLVPERKIAESICSNWKDNSSELYRQIIDLITKRP